MTTLRSKPSIQSLFTHPFRYEVNPEYVQQLEAAGMEFVGRDTTGERMEVRLHTIYLVTPYSSHCTHTRFEPSTHRTRFFVITDEVRRWGLHQQPC